MVEAATSFRPDFLLARRRCFLGCCIMSGNSDRGANSPHAPGGAMFDVLIQNGRVVDGTGQTWFRASVGITGDTVTLLRGDTASQARESGLGYRRYRLRGLPRVHRHAFPFRPGIALPASARGQAAAGSNHRDSRHGRPLLCPNLARKFRIAAAVSAGSQRPAAGRMSAGAA